MNTIHSSNRPVEWNIKCGIVYRAGTKHAEIIANYMGLEIHSKGVQVLGAKDAVDEFDDDELNGAEVMKFRDLKCTGLICSA